MASQINGSQLVSQDHTFVLMLANADGEEDAVQSDLYNYVSLQQL